MEKILRKILEMLVLIFAYIPMGAASIAFIWSTFIFFKHVVIWVRSGVWAVPGFFETVNPDFLSYLMDERISGYRIPLIKAASFIAGLPAPVFLLISGCVCLCTGLGMLYFAGTLKKKAR